ncbi:hypothetical protein C8A01DRAFT_39617 [Parachaetomium inaequale]|uniref:Uncharacterized protein n=1 Tax=Parachaetomium inaequale TaxID=2588326 RepID=A0AAN6PCM1_9PEZI|nr:hypothetical protein C8A01DRAFT_39617 [Parachaetomium inaequale]
MQFTSLFTILAVAMTASALPSDVVPRGGGGPSITSCSTQSANVCCNGIASCLLNVAAKDCSADSYCCESSAVQAGLVNVAADCLKLL